MTPLLTPLTDSEPEDVAKSEDEVLQQVGKLSTHDKINDSIPPDDSVAVEITIDEAVTSTVWKRMKLEMNLCSQSLNPNISILKTSGHR